MQVYKLEVNHWLRVVPYIWENDASGFIRLSFLLVFCYFYEPRSVEMTVFFCPVFTVKNTAVDIHEESK